MRLTSGDVLDPELPDLEMEAGSPEVNEEEIAAPQLEEETAAAAAVTASITSSRSNPIYITYGQYNSYFVYLNDSHLLLHRHSKSQSEDRRRSPPLSSVVSIDIFTSIAYSKTFFD